MADIEMSFVSKAALASGIPSPTDGLGAMVTSKDGGPFSWRLGNFTTQIAQDPRQILFVAHSTVATSTGCWVRQRDTTSINVMWSGTVGDDANDDKPAIQAAIDLLISQGGGEVVFPVPAIAYYLAIALIINSTAPVSLKGLGSVTGTYRPDFRKGMVTLHYGGVATSPAITAGGTSSSPNSGLSLESLFIYSPDQSINSGGVGLLIDQAYPFRISDVTIVGFATGALLRNGGKGRVERIAISRAARCRLEITALVDTVLWDPKLYEEGLPGYIYDLYLHDNAQIEVFGGALIGSFYPPLYNCYMKNSFALFNSVAFEGARTAGVAVFNDVSPAPENFTCILTDCTWNDQAGYVVDSQRAVTWVTNPRFQHTNNGTIDAAFRFLGGLNNEGSAPIGGGIRGGQGTFSVNAAGGCVLIAKANNVAIDGLKAQNVSGASGRPIVKIDSGCSYNSINRVMPFDGATAEVVDNGTLNSVTAVAESNWTPIVTASSGTLGGFNVNYARYWRDGRRFHYTAQISISAGSASGTVIVSLPGPIYSGYDHLGIGKNVSNSKIVQVNGEGSVLYLQDANGGFPIAGANNLIRISGTYERQ